METQARAAGPVTVHAEGGSTVAVTVHEHHHRWPGWLTPDTIIELARLIQKQRRVGSKTTI